MVNGEDEGELVVVGCWIYAEGNFILAKLEHEQAQGTNISSTVCVLYLVKRVIFYNEILYISPLMTLEEPHLTQTELLTGSWMCEANS